MLRIVDGIVFEGKPLPNTHTVTLHQLGNGHREASITPVITWQEVHTLHPDSVCAQVLRGERDDPQAEEKRERARKRSAGRARTKVRRLCKVMGLDTLLTLTYRQNVTDLAVCKAHLELFRKRMSRLLGGWLFVAAFERQKRGAVHVHIAMRSIPARVLVRGFKVRSWDAIRSLWRSVVGGLGGNVDIAGRQRTKRGVPGPRSPARIAGYISKYMLKDYETWPEGVRRFQASTCAIPEPERVRLVAENFADLVAMCYSFAADGDCEVISARVSAGGVFFLATERPG